MLHSDVLKQISAQDFNSIWYLEFTADSYDVYTLYIYVIIHWRETLFYEKVTLMQVHSPMRNIKKMLQRITNFSIINSFCARMSFSPSWWHRFTASNIRLPKSTREIFLRVCMSICSKDIRKLEGTVECYKAFTTFEQ